MLLTVGTQQAALYTIIILQKRATVGLEHDLLSQQLANMCFVSD